MNSLIESLFSNFSVNGVTVPVFYMFYDGHLDPYITYMQTDADSAYAGDNEVLGYVDYYDIDIYSKGNYTDIVNAVIQIMVNGGFTYQPSRNSSDMYETDTEYFHKTLCFAIEREVIISG